MRIPKNLMVFFFLVIFQNILGQEGWKYIVPKKVAVIRDPQTGFDAKEAFSPGSFYAVVDATTGDRGAIVPWNSGTTDASSGDRAWHFDFSGVQETGTYYILDEAKGSRSFNFIIAHFDKSNPASEKDVRGGWYDAGDYNKCTGWTAGPPNTSATLNTSAEGDTMYVEGRHLYTAQGEKVVLRGVNEMFVWSDDKRGQRLIPEIAQTGANCVRLVWTAEEGDHHTFMDLIERCIDHHMIAMPECHSATGDWSKLNVCVNFWKHPVLVEGIQRNRRWTLLNIGNEVGDGQVTAAQFKSGYQDAIDSLRSWGYTVPIVIDASTWGQNVDIILATWQAILEHDPLHNVIFSVHSYWSGTGNYQRVATASVNEGLPVIIGEGPSPTRYPSCEILDYATGLEVTGRNDIGWLSWSWGGVANGHCIPNFDHTSNGEFGLWRTTFAADMMADHPFSLMRTARRPTSFYSDSTVEPSGIYISPGVSVMTVGDTAWMEVLVTPVNVFDNGYSLVLSGDTGSVILDEASGMLVALKEGVVRVEAVSTADPGLTFIREIEVREIAVTGITITPSAADLLVGDTFFFSSGCFLKMPLHRDIFLK